MAEMLQSRQVREPVSDELANQLLEKEIVDDANRNWLRLTTPLVGEPERQLVEGQKMDVEEGELPFDGQEAPDAIEQRRRWNENRDRGEGIVGLTPDDVVDEGGFEMGMKATGDDLQHGPTF